MRLEHGSAHGRSAPVQLDKSTRTPCFWPFSLDCIVAPQLHVLARRGTNEHKGDDVAKEDRGFASMDRDKQKEIASKGGKAAHQKGTAHEWTSEEARDAGRKGGLASHRRRREQKDGDTRELVGVVSGEVSPAAARYGEQ